MVEDSIKNIENGNKLVESTAKQLEEIVGGSQKTADLVEEIATASKEQAQGLDQINKGLSQVDEVTQSNTANAEECASAAEELASQAQQLKAMVARFKLAKKTQEFKDRLEKGESLDDILPETFALVREAAKRTIKQRHFDVQMMAAITLHQGKIAEQKTGEGKRVF